MAVNLSSVTAGSMINLPMKDGTTCKAVVLAYNHYGKSESALLIRDGIGGSGIIAASYSGIISGSKSSYIGSNADTACMSWISTLADSIQASMTYVSLPCGLVDGSSRSTVTGVRGIFLPSLREIYSGTWTTGNINNQGSYSPISGEGSAFSQLASYIQTNNVNLLTRSPIFGYANVSLLQSASYDSSKWWTEAGGGSSYIDYATWAVTTYKLYPIICLNGSIQVASSSGGNITQSTALESYRKIDGKWYRVI